MKNELNFDDFWERLKNLCKEKDITQISLCEKLGIELQSFRNRKITKYFPPLQELYKIAKFFGVSIDFLVTGELSSDTEKTFLKQIQTYQTKLARIQKIISE